MTNGPGVTGTSNFTVDTENVVRDTSDRAVGFVVRRGGTHHFIPGHRPDDWDAAALLDIAALLGDLDSPVRLALVAEEEPEAEPEAEQGPDRARNQADGGPATRATPSPLAVARVASPAALHVASPKAAIAAEPSREGAVVDGVPIIGRVVDLADRYGYSLSALAAAALEPEQVWNGKPGSTCRLKGSVMVIVTDDTGEVIALSGRDQALRNAPRQGASGTGQPKAKSGGRGNRTPRDMPSLLKRLADLGFEVDGARPHYILTHPDVPGAQTSLAKTPSDVMVYEFMQTKIKHTFGIDIREGAK